MALDSIKLDDLSWNEMVVAIRRRIAAASDGNWTLHAPVDPGITLLELFAYLLDQRVYWMDQVSDSMVRGALSLLGEQPRSTRAAATVVHFPEIEEVMVLSAGTELTLARSAPPVIFSTSSEIALLPFENNSRRLSLYINEEDRTADLEHGKIMRLFPWTGSGEIKIVLWLPNLLPAGAKDKFFSLFFQLRTPAGIEPQWAPQWSDEVPEPVAPPAKLSWFYSSSGGKRIRFTANEISDGTGGLRRSGLIFLPVKTGTGAATDWLPESYDAKLKLHAYSLWLRVDETTFSAPPRLERLVPNVVIAAHERETEEHELPPQDFLPLPGNTLVLADLPANKLLKDHPPIENKILLKIREADGQWHIWRPVLDFSFHGPSNRVFIADRALGKISFGDGLTGRLPVLMNDGKSQIKIKYCVGGGVAGNLGANLDWETSPGRVGANLNWETAGVSEGRRLLAINLSQSEGGEEPETIAAARQRAGTQLRKRTRAVVRDDYEELARRIPGVAIKRAHAAIGLHPKHPCALIPGAVTVFIVPDVSRPDVLSDDSPEYDGSIVESAFVAAPVPDPGALALVRARLDKTRLAGSEVFVSAPHYQSVDLFLDVETNSVDTAELRRQIQRRLRKFLDPLIGGDASLGWPFGEPLRRSAILREAQDALGEEGRVLQLLIVLPDKSLKSEDTSSAVTPDCSSLGAKAESQIGKQGLQQNESPCADVLIGKHDLVELRTLTVNFSRGTKSQGGLR